MRRSSTGRKRQWWAYLRLSAEEESPTTSEPPQCFASRPWGRPSAPLDHRWGDGSWDLQILTTADGTSRSWAAPLDRLGGRPRRGARLQPVMEDVRVGEHTSRPPRRPSMSGARASRPLGRPFALGNCTSRPPRSAGPSGEEAVASPRQAGHRGSDGVLAAGGWREVEEDPNRWVPHVSEMRERE
jgi:hypothetical protein